MPNTGVMIHARRPPSGGDAAILCGAEPEAVCLAFTDMNAIILDTGNPSNNFTGNINDVPGLTIVTLLDTGDTPDKKWVRNSNNIMVLATPMRTHYNVAGVAQGVLLERVHKNAALWSDDFTDAVWVKTNMSTAKTATGPDGIGSSATTLTANAANATALQSVTESFSSNWITTVFCRRRTGTGDVEFTDDNSTFVTLTGLDTTWRRFNIPTSLVAQTATFGMRLVTSGDEVDVWGWNADANLQGGLTLEQSPVSTTTVEVELGSDDLNIVIANTPVQTMTATGDEYTVFVEYQGIGSRNGPRLCSINDGTVSDQIKLERFGGVLQFQSATSIGSTGTVNDTTVADEDFHKSSCAWAEDDVEMVTDGSVIGTDSTADLLGDDCINIRIGFWHFPIRSISIVPRRKSQAEMITETT